MVLILQEIDGAKEIGMTTVRFISDPDCNEADFEVGSFDDLLNLELSKV
jgi:FMN phosphatase YigB (HAD superfamily)